MGRVLTGFAVLALLVGGAVGTGPVAAQDATPGASPAASAALDGEVFTTQLLAWAVPRQPPPAPATLALLRYEFGAGTEAPIAPPDGFRLVAVEAGALVVGFDGPGRVWDQMPPAGPGRRGGGSPDPGWVVAAGEEAALGTSGAAAVPVGTVLRARNDGAEPAVALVAVLGGAEAAGGASPAPGVTVEVLGQGTADRLPEAGFRMQMVRWAFLPGYPQPPESEPGEADRQTGPGLATFESGAIEVRPVGGGTAVGRGGGAPEPVAGPTRVGAGDALNSQIGALQAWATASPAEPVVYVNIYLFPLDEILPIV